MDWAGDVVRDGYAIVPSILGDVEVACLVRALDNFRGSSTALEHGGEVYGGRDLLREVPEVATLAKSSTLLGLARRVLGERAFVVRGLLFDKTPQANWFVPWHQDLTIPVKAKGDVPGYGPWTRKAGIPHVRPPVAVLEHMVTLRVHLDDATEDRGPLRVLPGSHAHGRLGTEATREWLSRVKPRECLVDRGGVLVMRPLILHASSQAVAPDRRRVIHLEYAADQLPGGVEWFEAEN